MKTFDVTLETYVTHARCQTADLKKKTTRIGNLWETEKNGNTTQISRKMGRKNPALPGSCMGKMDYAVVRSLRHSSRIEIACRNSSSEITRGGTRVSTFPEDTLKLNPRAIAPYIIRSAS